MAFPDDPRDLEVGFAFGSPASADPTGLTYEVVAPGTDLDDPGDVLGVVMITRGRVGDQGTTDATRIETALRNSDGQYSPRHVTGDRYGTLRKGTPMQVRVDGGSGMVVRGRAAQPDWNPRWTGPDIDDQVRVEAYGILSRIGRGRESLSAIRRTILAASPAAYWPLEDGLDADIAGSGVPNAAPLRVAGSITFAQDDGLPGSQAAPDMTAGALRGSVPSGGSSTAWCVEFWLRANFTAGSRAAYFETSSVGVEQWGIRVPASASGQFDVFVEDSNGSTVASLLATVSGWTEAEWHHFAITAEQDGANIQTLIYSDGELTGGGQIFSATLGRVTRITLNDFDTSDFSDLLSCAHVAVLDGTTPSGAADAGDGYAGEPVADRIRRLCDEEGIARFVPFSPIDGTAMGVQKPDTVLALLRECEAADHGILYERTDGRLAYKQLNTLYNLFADLELDHGTEADPGNCNVYPIDDDRDLYNLVTVTRRDGASATAEQETGPVGTDEDDGIGPRPLPVTLNLATDGQTTDHAAWLLHETTIDQPRFIVTIDLRATPDLIGDWLACDIGSRITVANPPAKTCGPDDLDLILVGYVETIGADVWTAELHCEPYGPWNIAEVGHDDLGILGTDSAIIRESLDTTETGIDITCGHADWVYEEDFDVVVGGEQMTVTAVSAVTGTFPTRIATLTVVRSVNGVVKTHALNTPIRLFHQAYIGL